MAFLIVLYVILILAIVFLPLYLKRKKYGSLKNDRVRELENEIISRELHERIIEKIQLKFDKSFIEERGYLDPDITIVGVAKRLDTNRTYLSEIINTKYGMSFRDLVNKLRIEYAKKILLDDPKATIVSVSGRCGFLGSNQFVRKFRELEGSTPAVWRAGKLQGDLKIC